ncbi:MAG: 2,3-bisphosphoglycerate-independent phosphoglycerate mutase [Planctomycetota bacterium]|jgi:2,3-bisphosphoglycerate-independent phosphoglycerate mutase|nr:2,3-bisphosphoglycerate-independent phosphoglycerate mutase [Planctomycetota bacterium]
MKALILLPTGLSDLPVPSLEGQTPLAAAETPHLDTVAREGRLGTVRPVPAGLPISSDAALISLLGYDPRREQVSRAGLEALGLGVNLASDDYAFRMNFASTFREHLVDFQAGPIGSEEAAVLIAALNAQLGSEHLSFHGGLGYRNLMVIHGRGALDAKTVPPARAQGLPVQDHQPEGPDGPFLTHIMEQAAQVLGEHDVNRVRLDLNENPADRIWLWGGGSQPVIEPFEVKTGRRLGVVGAVPLARGLGRAVGATVPTLPGATGDFETSYEEKLSAAFDLLESHDVVLVHVAAANEACHQTDVRLKQRALEEMDRRLVGPALADLRGRDDVRLLVTTDHMTSALVGSEGMHDLVPFALWGPGVSSHREVRYTEADAAKGDLVVDPGYSLLELLLKPNSDGVTRKTQDDMTASENCSTRNPT